MYELVIKPFLEFSLAFFLLLFFLPFLLLVSFLLLYVNSGKIFFYQTRPGKNEVLFKIWKFKTMNDKRDKNGNLLPDSLRITRVGKLIRKLSIDEIPQLWNVLRGEMSIVGPRPLLVQYLPLYNEREKLRHNVKPGITGWAQVNGRNNISWKEKFELDIWYVENQSFLLDVKILFLTILKVIRKEGIAKVGNATTDAYNGNN